jgi:hypothetical protein
MTDLECKIKILKEMNAHVIKDIGDDDITDYWLTYGVPDDPSEDDYQFIAENWDCWVDTLKAFTRCLVMNGEM